MLAPVGHGAAIPASVWSVISRWLTIAARALGWTGTPAVGLVLASATIAACLIRAAGLPDVPGTLARDESRLALAAQGILTSGLPTSPGGVLYTRGLMPGYVEAATFAVLGISDQAARLPALIVGTLLIPATFWLARGFSREWPAAAAAAIVALSPPLIELSREAWLYPWLTLWTVISAGWLVRAHVTGRSSAYLLAGLAYVAAVFSHELAAVFLPAVLVTQLIRIKSSLKWGAIRSFWLIAIAATVAALALTTVLRSPTQAGSGSEFQSYLRSAIDLRGLPTLLRLIAESHPWLVPVSALALAFLLMRPRSRAALWLPVLTVLALLIFNGFILTRRGHPRDIQVLIPFLAVTATFAAWHLAPFIVCTLLAWRPTAWRFRWLGASLGLLLVIASIPITTIGQSMQRPRLSPTWLEAMSGYRPGDVVLSFAPTQTSHYLGKTDFWLRPNGYSRYVWAGPPPYRDIYTGAVVVRNARELENLVITPNRGRTLWVLGQRDLPPEQRSGLTEMFKRLAPITVEEPHTGDETRVLRVQL